MNTGPMGARHLLTANSGKGDFRFEDRCGVAAGTPDHDGSPVLGIHASYRLKIHSPPPFKMPEPPLSTDFDVTGTRRKS